MSESDLDRQLNRVIDRGVRLGLRVAGHLRRPVPRALTHAWALRRPLGELALELTSYCNLECKMCSVWQGRQHGVSLEHAKRLLAQAYTLGARRFTPFGAEQFMRKDLIDVLEHAHGLGYSQQMIVSNGAMITARHIERLARLPSVSLNISIDGPRELHDELRGVGIYDKAMTAVRALHAAKVPTGLSGVLMRETLATATHIIDVAAELGLKSVSYQPFQSEIAGAIDYTRFAITEAERPLLVRTLDGILAHARSRRIKVYTADLFPLVPAYLLDGLRPIPEGGCMVPSRSAVVMRSGEVYPCFFMLDRSIGNVNAHSLTELWHNDIQRELNRDALAERCPGCLAACSDVPSYVR